MKVYSLTSCRANILLFFLFTKYFSTFFKKYKEKFYLLKTLLQPLKTFLKPSQKTLLFFVIFLNPEYMYMNYTFYTYNTNNTYKKLFVRIILFIRKKQIICIITHLTIS